jgi:hypothetical protein
VTEVMPEREMSGPRPGRAAFTDAVSAI